MSNDLVHQFTVDTFTPDAIAELQARIDTILAGPPSSITGELMTLFAQAATRAFAVAAEGQFAPDVETLVLATNLLECMAAMSPEARPSALGRLMDRVAACRDKSNAKLLMAEADRRDRAARTFPESSAALQSAAEGFRFGANLILAQSEWKVGA